MNDGSQSTERIYAWIGRDHNGIEGVLAYPFTDGTPMPLVATEQSLARRLKGAAHEAAQASELTVHLVVFERGETLDSVQ